MLTEAELQLYKDVLRAEQKQIKHFAGQGQDSTSKDCSSKEEVDAFFADTSICLLELLRWLLQRCPSSPFRSLYCGTIWIRAHELCETVEALDRDG